MEKKTRYSDRRSRILEAIRSTKTHPTAEWVFQTVKKVFIHEGIEFKENHQSIMDYFAERGDGSETTDLLNNDNNGG